MLGRVSGAVAAVVVGALCLRAAVGLGVGGCVPCGGVRGAFLAPGFLVAGRCRPRAVPGGSPVVGAGVGRLPSPGWSFGVPCVGCGLVLL